MKIGKRGKYKPRTKPKTYNVQKVTRHRSTKYIDPEDIKRWKAPEFDLQQFMQEIY
jgi:hypothetical protein